VYRIRKKRKKEKTNKKKEEKGSDRAVRRGENVFVQTDPTQGPKPTNTMD